MARYNIPYWKQAPFVRLIFPFVCGIIGGRYLPLSSSHYLVLVAFTIACATVYALLRQRWQFSFKAAMGIVLMLLITLVGGYISSQTNPFKSVELVTQYGLGSAFIVSIEEPALEKKSSWKAIAKIESISTAYSTTYSDSYVLVYFRKYGTRAPPAYGSKIQFTTSLQRIENNAGSGGFNYAEYCALKNIHFQVFLRPEDYVVLEVSSGGIYGFIFKIQNWVLAQLKKCIPGKRELGLAEALLIGYKNDLDRNLIQAYSNAGVVHVVAISGLHLGLIYGMLAALCSPIKNNRGGRILQALIILTGLWIFSLLAGASPSVLRSAVMFSFLVIGKLCGRRSGMLNSLSASAFFLLCCNAYWLWDLGFILSYAALLSIILFQNQVNKIYNSRNKLVQQLWNLTAVTIAAQILTMPVIIYFFHQIPNLFIITNLIAIPLSSIILIGEILLCILFFADAVAEFMGQLLSVLIRCMNTLVELSDSFSFSSTKNLNISFFQLIILYIFIAFIAQWLLHKKKMGLPAALISLIVFFLVVLHPFEATS